MRYMGAMLVRLAPLSTLPPPKSAGTINSSLVFMHGTLGEYYGLAFTPSQNAP